MFKFRFYATLLVASLALHAQTDHDAPVQIGNGSLWLSLDESITQFPAPADANRILQHTHHDVTGGHKIRVFDAGDLSGGVPKDFSLGDQLLIFLAGDANTSPSVIIRAEKSATAVFPKHAGHKEALCGRVVEGVSCRPDWLALLKQKDLLELTDAEVADLGPNKPFSPDVQKKLQATLDRLTHIWSFTALNNGQFVRTQSKVSGRIAYYFKSSSGSMSLRPVRIALVKAGTTEQLSVAERIDKRRCWLVEISYPEMKSKIERSSAREELQKLKDGCKGCWIGSCKLCPSEVYKPSQTPYVPGAGGPSGHSGH